MSPYFSSDPSPLAYSRHYTVTTEEGFLITMEVTMNLLLYILYAKALSLPVRNQEKNSG